MRGKRTQDGIFFRVKSVMEVFKMPNLESNIQLAHTTYNNEHYVSFNVSESYAVSNRQHNSLIC